ncbi:MAG: hypothetical protein KGI79_01105 [Patescibacteria group bacterium]|nr:hypothetical protein [Patescibacteria group bacterium]MDE2116455.1 hypothetical protein [Patescibacteria group bacterium]
MSLGPFTFAKANPVDSSVIMLNVNGSYEAMPDSKQAEREHCLMQILNAIGLSEKNGVVHEAVNFANEIRSEFSGGGKSKK